MSEIKHVGRIKATNKKCLVAYRTLPGDAYSCLVIPTENLPDSYHDSLINLVESTAGQDSYEFAEALARTNFPDGSIMLSALHTQNRLVKVGTDQVEMQPTPAVSISLAELNQIIAEQRGIAVDGLTIQPERPAEPRTRELGEPSIAEPASAKTTSGSINDTEEPVNLNLTPEQQAKEYRSKADKLAKEAAAFRRMAEDLVPTKKK
jgi:hypothetical protein